MRLFIFWLRLAGWCAVILAGIGFWVALWRLVP